MNQSTSIFSTFPLGHHAYGIESLGSIGTTIKESIPVDSCSYIFHKTYDSLKIDDVREIRSLQSEKTEDPAVFIIEFSLINIESQNALLKIIEEPTENTFFIFIFPDKSKLLATVLSRLEIIRYTAPTETVLLPLALEPANYCALTLAERFARNKELTDKKNDESMTKTQILQFLEALEIHLHNSQEKNSVKYQAIYDARAYLHANGASSKMILDMVALHL